MLFKSRPILIVTTLILALLLNLIHYPQWMIYAKPDFVLLVLFYWCLALPKKIGVGWGWGIGLVLDILHYTLLGKHAIAKAFVALIAVMAYKQVRLYHLWQQCVLLFFVVSIDIGFVSAVNFIALDVPFKVVYWQSAFATVLVWPLVYVVLRQLRQRAKA